MRVIFSGSLSDEAVGLASRVADLLTDDDCGIEVRAWFSSEMTDYSPEGYSENLAWDSLEVYQLERRKFSRRTLNSYRQFISRTDYSEFFSLAIKLLNRRDFTGTFRMLEREVVLQHSVLVAIEYFSETKPDLVVFPVTPHLFMPKVANYACICLGIPVLYFQPCPLAPAVFPIIQSATGERLVTIPPAVSLKEEVLSIAAQELSSLKSLKDPSYMRIQRGRDIELRRNRKRLRSALLSLRWLKTRRYAQSVDFSGFGGNKTFFWRALRIILNRKLQAELSGSARSVCTSIEPGKRYCLFALHYEPERTSLPEGLPILFQADAVAVARAIIPAEVSLIVKEHYSQISSALRGFLGRSPQMYDLLNSYSNLQFAQVEGYLSDLIDGADCVFTLTGTIAIESAFRGVPVGYFGKPWWEGMPGTTHVGQEASFTDITEVSSPDPNEVFEFLMERIRLNAIVGLGSEPLRTVGARLGPLPETLHEDEARAVAGVIKNIPAADQLD